MEQENSDLRELSPEMLDAVSGGRNMTPYDAVMVGLILGFAEAGGTVTCYGAGKGVSGCHFTPSCEAVAIDYPTLCQGG